MGTVKRGDGRRWQAVAVDVWLFGLSFVLLVGVAVLVWFVIPFLVILRALGW